MEQSASFGPVAQGRVLRQGASNTMTINIAGVRINQDLILCVKIEVYMGCWVHRGF